MKITNKEMKYTEQNEPDKAAKYYIKSYVCCRYIMSFI